MEKLSVPRVTEVLGMFSSYNNVPPDVLENAATRGSKVHGLCALLAQDLWMPPCTEELQLYVDSFSKWHNCHVKRLYMVEKRLIDKCESYTGQIDFVFGLDDEKKWLVDLKTCYAPQKTHYVQMAAYRDMLKDNDIEVEGAKLVYAQKSGGDPKVITLSQDELNALSEVFHAALKCYEYFKRKKKKKTK